MRLIGHWALGRLWAPEGEAGGGTGSAGTEGVPPRPTGRAGAAMTLTPDELNEIVESRIARERQKWEIKLGGPNAADELERLRKADADRKRREAEERGNYERALQSKDEEWKKQLTERETRLSTLTTELRKDRVRGAIIGAAAELRAIKPDQIADLLEGRRITLDDDSLGVVVLDASGKPAFVSGKPMTVKQLVDTYLQENPHLAQPAGTGGSGSRGGASTSETGGPAHGETAALKAAREKAAAATAKAEKSGQTGDVTVAQKAWDAVRQLERDAQAKAS